MVLSDWTVSGIGTASLDTVIKQAGPSSCKLSSPTNVSGTTTLTHDTFSEPQAQIIAWSRWSTGGDYARPVINLSGYGNANIYSYMNENEWVKFKVTYWYDATSDAKWGRIEKWIDSAWVQQGGDINYGAGSPAAGSLSLNMVASHSYPGFAWFDEVEVSA